MTEKTSLKDFVKDNYPLIATIGIMGALTALILELTEFTLLAFVPLALMFILTWELVSQFPVIEKCGWRLVSFMILIVSFFIIIGGYIFTAYIVTFYKLFIFGVFFGVYMIIWWLVLKKIKMPNRIRMGLLYIGEIFLIYSALESATYIIGLLNI